MIVQIICVQMRDDDNFIIIAPHTASSFNADGVSFFGCNFSCDKALIPVICYITAQFAIAPLACHHTLISSLWWALDSADKYPLVGLIVVAHIVDGGGKVGVQIASVSSLVGMEILSIFLLVLQKYTLTSSFLG